MDYKLDYNTMVNEIGSSTSSTTKISQCKKTSALTIDLILQSTHHNNININRLSLSSPTLSSSPSSSSKSSSSANRPRRYKCKQCEYIAISKQDFWTHRPVHIKREKQLTCPNCPFVTEFKHHLEYHLRNHFNSKPFLCSFPGCKYTCVNKSMLNSHLKSHSSVYQFQCKDCSYATKYCHSLKMHLRKHKHQPSPVLNLDGTINPYPIIDVYGTRRGPRPKKKQSSSSSSSSSLSTTTPPIATTPPKTIISTLSSSSSSLPTTASPTTSSSPKLISTASSTTSSSSSSSSSSSISSLSNHDFWTLSDIPLDLTYKLKNIDNNNHL